MNQVYREIRLVKLTHSNINKLSLIDFSERMMKYITGKALSYTEAVDRYSVDIDHRVFGSYFVEYSDLGEIVGFAVIKDQEIKVEIGYLVLEPYRGMGIATRINKKLIHICCKNLSNRIVIAQTDIRNKASIRVLEKSGMTKIDTIQEDGKTVCMFTINS